MRVYVRMCDYVRRFAYFRNEYLLYTQLTHPISLACNNILISYAYRYLKQKKRRVITQDIHAHTCIHACAHIHTNMHTHTGCEAEKSLALIKRNYRSITYYFIQHIPLTDSNTLVQWYFVSSNPCLLCMIAIYNKRKAKALGGIFIKQTEEKHYCSQSCKIFKRFDKLKGIKSCEMVEQTCNLKRKQIWQEL